MTLLSNDLHVTFRDQLCERGLLIPTAVPGIYLRSAEFERVSRGIGRLISESGRDQDATGFFAPSLIARQIMSKTDYVRSFPQLAGFVATYANGEDGYPALVEAIDSDTDWFDHLGASDLALCPAACHAIYPLLTGTQLPVERRFEIVGECYRHEPSSDPTRLQSFRMHEYVYVGSEEGAVAHRDLWMGRALDLLGQLGLTVELTPANDPFFGRAGRLLAETQRAGTLKYEVVTHVAASGHSVAIASANCHLDHFGTAFDISQPDGESAHSACIGFGIERITLALFSRHGLESRYWPESLQQLLGL